MSTYHKSILNCF